MHGRRGVNVKRPRPWKPPQQHPEEDAFEFDPIPFLDLCESGKQRGVLLFLDWTPCSEEAAAAAAAECSPLSRIPSIALFSKQQAISHY
jgi:hypothetical protein